MSISEKVMEALKAGILLNERIVGHPWKQRRHNAKCPDIKAMEGLHCLYEALAIVVAESGQFSQLFTARQSGKYPGSGCPKSTFLIFKLTTQTKAHGVPFLTSHVIMHDCRYNRF